MKFLPVLLLSVLLAACSSGNNAPAPHNEPATNTTTDAGPKRDPKKAAKLFKQASMKYLAGDKSGAAELLEQALPLDPDNSELIALFGHAMEKLQRYEKARDLYKRAAKLVDGKAQYNMKTLAAHCSEMLAHNQYTAGDYETAWSNIKAAIEDGADSRETQMLRGYIQMQRKDYKDAAEAFDAAVGLSTGPQRYEALSWLGQAQYAGNDYETAIGTFSKLINENAEGYEAYGYRAYCEVALQKNDDARRDFEQALQRSNDAAKQDGYRAALKALEDAK